MTPTSSWDSGLEVLPAGPDGHSTDRGQRKGLGPQGHSAACPHTRR